MKELSKEEKIEISRIKTLRNYLEQHPLSIKTFELPKDLYSILATKLSNRELFPEANKKVKEYLANVKEISKLKEDTP